MDKQTLEFVKEKTKVMTAQAHCCPEAKAAAEKWLAAVGTDKELEETKKYIAEFEEDIVPIDGLIAFGEAESTIKKYGAEAAKNIADHAKERKAHGAKYCDCGACSAVEAILSKKKEMLAE